MNIYFYAHNFLTDGLAVFYINIEFHDKFAVDKFVIVPLGVLTSAGGFHDQAFAGFIQYAKNFADAPVFAIMFLHDGPAFAAGTVFAVENQKLWYFITIQIGYDDIRFSRLPELSDIRIVNRRTFRG